MFQCVYSIQCLDPEIKEFYIGSTDNLKQRVITHKSRYNTGYNTKVYKFIRDHGGLNNWEINYIQKFKFLTELELRQYEQWYLDTYKPQLNCMRAYITEEQKNIDHKIRTKKYYENNKVAIFEMNKKYKEKNIEKVIKWKQKSYSKHSKKYAEKRKEKGNCPHCNLEILKNNIKRHIKTQHPTST